MKKSIIALMGLFTLIACSEDSYQEADKMNENSANAVESTGSQNSVKTVDSTIPYASPYGTTDRITYIFQNDTDYEFRFQAIIHLCFFDGSNNNVHFGHNLSMFPYFAIPFPNTNWNEYTWSQTAKMITIPPHTTETIKISGKILPVDPSGPKTASGQYFDLNKYLPGIMPAISNAEIDFFGNYGKFVGFEGAVYDPATSSNANTTLRFPLGPQYSNISFWGSSFWANVPIPGSTQQKLFNTQTNEICTANPSPGLIGSRPSFQSFTINGSSHVCSAYTTTDSVVVVVQ